MILRKANEKDLDKCLELLKEDDFRYCTGEFPDRDFIIEFFNEYFYVLEKNDKIVGCYLATKIFSNGVYLWYLVIDKEFRGQNLGTYILENMEKIHKSENRTWIYFISPLNNIDFYTKKGYIPHHTIVKEFFKNFI